MVDQLTPLDQVRLLEYLTLRITRLMESTLHPAPIPTTASLDAWKEFFQIGDMIADSDTPRTETLTTAVLKMRR